VNATLMGFAFMSLFIANNLIGWIGGFYEKMRPADFWAMHAAIAAGGGVLVLLFGRRLSRALQPASRS
jgi:POT family proton-dependent oligopeptide transporter